MVCNTTECGVVMEINYTFGKVGEVTGLNIEDIFDAIRGIIYNIKNTSDTILSNLKNRDKQAYDKLMKARHYYSVYLDGISLNYATKAFYTKAIEMCNELQNNEAYKSELKKIWEYLMKNLNMDFDTFKKVFSQYLIVEFDNVNLYNDFKIIIAHIHDSKTDPNLNFEEVGEFVIYNLPKDKVSNIMLQILESISKVGK